MRVARVLFDEVRPRRSHAIEGQCTRGRVKFGKGLVVAGETRSFRTDLGCPAQIGLQTKGIVLIRPIIADVPADLAGASALSAEPDWPAARSCAVPW